MERQTMMFNKFSLSCEVLKYLTYADTAISFLHRLWCQSREMILKNWQLITKLVEKREITLWDRAQFDRLIDTKIILFKLAIIFGYNGTLTIKDLNHFADKLVVLFKQNTQNLINSGTQGVTEEDYLKYYSAEISSISKTEDSDIRYKTSFEYINLKYMETIISLERIDRNLLNWFLGKVKFYSYIGNLSDISSYVKPLLQSHQQIIDEYNHLR